VVSTLMTPAGPTKRTSRRAMSGSHHSPLQPAPRGLDKASVAGLSRSDISTMSREDLAEAIRLVEVRQPGSRHYAYEYMDRSILERLVYQARRCCRNQGY